MSSLEQAPAPIQLLDCPDRKLVLRGDGPTDTAIGKLTLELTGVEKPSMLIIPTPAPSQEYYDKRVSKMRATYEQLGAKVKVLHGFGETPTEEQIAEAFASADAYDITGGSTKGGVERMTNVGIDLAIQHFRGVGSGGSAGLNAHFSQSLSWDTPDPKEHPELNEWRNVGGLQLNGQGIVRAYASPHADYIEGNFKEFPGENVYKGKVITQPRTHYFVHNLKQLWASGKPNVPSMGIAVDNDAALIFDGSGNFGVASKEHAVKHDGSGLPVGVSAWHQSPSGLAVPRLFEASSNFQPIANLVAIPAAA